MVSQTSVNELLKGVQQLSAKDFDVFFKKISKLHSEQGTNSLTTRERRILNQIKANMPDVMEHRYALLIAKRDLRTLTDSEYEELLLLTDKAEAHQTKRLHLMAELAQLMELTLPEVLAHYKLQPQPLD